MMKRKRALTVMLIAGIVIASMALGGARLVAASPSGSTAGRSDASAHPILHWPLRLASQDTGSARFVITGPFGEIPNPLTGKTYQHTAIDVTARGAQGHEAPHVFVVAAAPGQVSDEGFNPVAGNFVEVRHSDFMVTFYCKLAEPAVVKVGDSVGDGQVLGTMGSTGTSTGPHLHFEVHVNGVPVDPMEYVSMP